VIGIGADDVEGLLERHFNLESQAIVYRISKTYPTDYVF
jgi:hypothetical protein